MKKVLSIAGSDCSGGAGIQADSNIFGTRSLWYDSHRIRRRGKHASGDRSPTWITCLQ